jgi:hypothetical protein
MAAFVGGKPIAGQHHFDCCADHMLLRLAAIYGQPMGVACKELIGAIAGGLPSYAAQVSADRAPVG